MGNKSPYKRGGMFKGANHLVFELAKDLRRNMTDAETVLWLHLKAGINGLKFRRQHPIGIYIADFYCHKIKLIIEADGGIHTKKEVKEYDEKRERDLIDMGNTIIRFTNDEIMKGVEKVIADIETKVEELKQSIIIN
jgi:imidazole glycerol-phosphate synthase subunit HisF